MMRTSLGSVPSRIFASLSYVSFIARCGPRESLQRLKHLQVKCLQKNEQFKQITKPCLAHSCSTECVQESFS